MLWSVVSSGLRVLERMHLAHIVVILDLFVVEFSEPFESSWVPAHVGEWAGFSRVQTSES